MANLSAIGKRFPESFIFPVSVSVGAGSIHDSYHNVLELLEEESARQFTPNNKLENLYSISFRPIRSNCKSVILNCWFCRAELLLEKQKDGKFIVRKVSNKHSHRDPQPIPASPTRLSHRKGGSKSQIEQQTCKGRTTDSTVKQVARIHFAKEDLQKGLKKLTENPPIILKSSTNLQKYNRKKMLSRHLESLGLRSIESECDDKFNPEWVVSASESMLKTYTDYGDVVAVYRAQHVMVTLEELPASIWLFAAVDNNSRLVLVGIGIILRQQEGSYQKVLQSFVKLHQREPKTIFMAVSSQMQGAAEALCDAKKLSTKVALDSGSILERALTLLQGNQQELRKSRKLVQDILTCRDPLELVHHFETIHERPKQNQEVMENFLMKCLDKCAFLFFDGFLGLQTDPLGRLDRRLKRFLVQKTKYHIFRFMEKLLEFEQELLKESRQRSFYLESLEKMFSDCRLGTLHKQVQSVVLDRFMENYVSATLNFQVRQTTRDYFGDTVLFIIGSKNNSSAMEVYDWKCKCEETGKTGVPCPHLIQAALSDPRKGYIELFHERWKIKECEHQDNNPHVLHKAAGEDDSRLGESNCSEAT